MRFLILLLLTFFLSASFAQSNNFTTKKRQYPIFSVNYAYGNILPTNDFVLGHNLLGESLNNFQAYTIKILWQNPGYTDWQKVYRAPYYGAGLSFGDFFNPVEVGEPMSFFGVLGIPLKRWEKLEIYSEFQYGIACNWVHYDPLSNPYNLAIGGNITIHFNMGLNAFVHISKKIDLGIGMSFIHFSSGGIVKPNKGFNIYSPSVELKYYISNRPNVKSVKSPGRLEHSNDLYFMLSYGNHQLEDLNLDPNYFAIIGLSTVYFTQVSNIFRFGFGTDLNYWMGTPIRTNEFIETLDIQNLTIGLFLQPEFIIDKLSMVSGIGIYASHTHYGNFDQIFQRLGVRYEFYKNLSAGINVRTINFKTAEYFEFNLGYSIKWKK